ncbi:MAG: class I SAM-dependent methyltransferase [Planctomycetes bacterium]|nr:class I SAM-dependent methyltransferase [Planctomycetota bacterium]
MSDPSDTSMHGPSGMVMRSTDDPHCPVCGGADSVRGGTMPAFEPLFRAAGRAFERCRRCGFVRMAEAPAPSRLADFYRADRASAASARQDHERNLERFGSILESIERHRRPGVLLDVGCSIGTSLVAARDRGWRPIGLELSTAAVAVARGQFEVDVRQSTLAASGLEPGSIDAVLMHHTLEHVEAPDRVLGEILAVLKPGGVMYQSLPNHGSLKARLLGRHFGYGITDEHLSHFTARTLRRSVQRAGFEVRAIETWSYRQDPRLLHDLCGRFGLERWLARRCGVPAGEALTVERYVAFLSRSRWAHFLCNRVWPQRLCRWLQLGEDLHLIATKPG